MCVSQTTSEGHFLTSGSKLQTIISKMSSRLVPLDRYDWDFVDRQMSLFPSFRNDFDKDFFSGDFKSANIEDEIAKMKRDGESTLKVDQPFVEDFSGNKRMALRFDCSKFNPEEIQVKTVDNNLTVHTDESPGRKVYREFTKSYTLPENIDPLSLKSSLTRDGFLQVEVPAPTTCLFKIIIQKEDNNVHTLSPPTVSKVNH